LNSLVLDPKSIPESTSSLARHDWKKLDHSQFEVGLIDGFIEGSDPAKMLDYAMRTQGFALLRHPDFDEEFVAQTRAVAENFFCRSLEHKKQFQLQTAYGIGGYTAVGGEAVGRSFETSAAEESIPVDLVESLALTPNLIQQFQTSDLHRHNPIIQQAEAYKKYMYNALTSLLKLAAQAGDYDEKHLMSGYDLDSDSLGLRFSYYPALAQPPTTGQMRYGAHTDFLGFTLLAPDPLVDGLEVLDITGVWKRINMCLLQEKSTLIINAGDLWPVITEGRWMSAIHRVANPLPQHYGLARLSLVFFTGPRPDTPLEPLRRAKSEPILTAGQFLQKKLGIIGVG